MTPEAHRDRAELVQHAAARRGAESGRTAGGRGVPRRPSGRIVSGAAGGHSQERLLRRRQRAARSAGRRVPGTGGASTRRTHGMQTAAAAGLAAADVPRLKLKWAFGIPGVSASGSQVTVVGSRVFVGSRNGMVYALDTKTGCLAWAFEADAGVRSTPVVGRGADGGSTVYFGDAHAQVYALDAATGARRWKVKVEDHLDAMITGAVAFHNGRALRAGVVARRRDGGDPDATSAAPSAAASSRSTPRPGGRSGRPTRFRASRSERRRAANGTQLWGPSGAACGRSPRSIPSATGSTSRPATATRIHPRPRATRSWRWRWTPDACSGRRQTLAGRCLERRLPRDRTGPRELSGEGRTRLRLRQLARDRHAAGWSAHSRRRSEVGRVVRHQPRHR